MHESCKICLARVVVVRVDCVLLLYIGTCTVMHKSNEPDPPKVSLYRGSHWSPLSPHALVLPLPAQEMKGHNNLIYIINFSIYILM